MSDYADTIILGGGLSGLSLAKFLNGRDCLILEADERPGGLCRSFQKDGFTYDIGGHILFSREQDLLQTLLGWLGDNLLIQRRNNQIWFRDRFVKYPFENDLAALDKEDAFACLMGFLKRNADGVPTNLEEWSRFRFGDGISEKYLLPYNDKIWKRAAKDISVHWVERIPSPPLEDVVKSAIGIETEGYTHQLNFYYPKQGGIEALIHSLASDAPLVTGFRVNKVKKTAEGWEVSDGKRVYGCRDMVSTIPVFHLVRYLEGTPQPVLDIAEKLIYNSLILVMIGVGHEGLMDKSAIYMPGSERLPHRVCYMSYFSPHNAPKGSSNLAAEITVHPDDSLLKADDGELVERTLKDVADLCGIKAGEVTASEVRRIPHAYVVYDLDYQKNRGAVYDYLDGLGLYTCGRWGSFEYLNMDKCIEKSKQLADFLKT
jgi:protoporphyrinogen oxidase